jgi:uncharacterized protein YdhG (YjbR/CyaY superfamily)
MKKPLNTDAYISAFPKETQKLLKLIRATIKKAAPMASEKIRTSERSNPKKRP